MSEENLELAQAVYQMMSKILIDRDTGFRVLCDNEEELGARIVQSMGEIRVSKPHKIRHHFSNVIGYGYDFTQFEERGIPTREFYENVVRNAKTLGSIGEKLIHDEVLENRFGLYMTQI
ncbi:MAG: hypothetical protein KKC19_03660 [Nanoarchaeota archaeon]|nr:hypothetical protein [Nanoarchaeota archaeon]